MWEEGLGQGQHQLMVGRSQGNASGQREYQDP